MPPAPLTLDDFIAQMNQVKKLGPMGRIMGMKSQQNSREKARLVFGKMLKGRQE